MTCLFVGLIIFVLCPYLYVGLIIFVFPPRKPSCIVNGLPWTPHCRSRPSLTCTFTFKFFVPVTNRRSPVYHRTKTKKVDLKNKRKYLLKEVGSYGPHGVRTRSLRESRLPEVFGRSRGGGVRSKDLGLRVTTMTPSEGKEVSKQRLTSV